MGLYPMTWDRDLSQNEELDTQLTEPPRHPRRVIDIRKTCTHTHTQKA